MMKSASRSDAKASCQQFYFTGRECLRGHVADRYASSGECVTCEQDRRERTAATRQKRAADWYAKNAEEKKMSCAAWYADNRDRHQAARMRWEAENKGARRAIAARRRARERKAAASWEAELTAFIEAEAFDLATLRENATGIAWDVDHMIPLAAKNACGLHVWNNLQVIPATMNGMKHNKMMWTEPGEWIVKRRYDFAGGAPCGAP